MNTFPDLRETDARDAGAAIDIPPDIPRGCAWFDSSLDLNLGLRVRELDMADPRCGAAFLDGWLAWATGAPAAGRRAQQA